MDDRVVSQPDDIIDAEFETVGRNGAPRAVSDRPATDARPGHGLGLFGGRAANTRRKGEPMPLPAFAAIATLSALASFYLAGGHALFGGAAPHTPPGMAGALPVVLVGATTRVDTSGGRAVIVVRADLHNRSAQAAAAPAVAITFEQPDGGGSLTHTVAGGDTLAAGERMAFTSRIPAGDYAGIEPRIALAPSR